MCLAVPFRLKEINGADAVGERGGITRNIRVDFIPEPKVGDYVMVHAGFAIERLGEEQALADLDAYREFEEALREIQK